MKEIDYKVFKEDINLKLDKLDFFYINKSKRERYDKQLDLLTKWATKNKISSLILRKVLSELKKEKQLI